MKGRIRLDFRGAGEAGLWCKQLCGGVLGALGLHVCCSEIKRSGLCCREGGHCSSNSFVEKRQGLSFAGDRLAG